MLETEIDFFMDTEDAKFLEQGPQKEGIPGKRMPQNRVRLLRRERLAVFR
jgi:hypothetical protein